MSCDTALGLPYNMVQVYVFLAIMAKITGLKPGLAYHKLINVHIYENQLEPFKTQLERKPYKSPKFHIDESIKTLEDLETWVTPDNFKISEYMYHPAIKYSFTV